MAEGSAPEMPCVLDGAFFVAAAFRLASAADLFYFPLIHTFSVRQGHLLQIKKSDLLGTEAYVLPGRPHALETAPIVSACFGTSRLSRIASSSARPSSRGSLADRRSSSADGNTCPGGPGPLAGSRKAPVDRAGRLVRQRRLAADDGERSLEAH